MKYDDFEILGVVAHLHRAGSALRDLDEPMLALVRQADGTAALLGFRDVVKEDAEAGDEASGDVVLEATRDKYLAECDFWGIDLNHIGEVAGSERHVTTLGYVADEIDWETGLCGLDGPADVLADLESLLPLAEAMAGEGGDRIKVEYAALVGISHPNSPEHTEPELAYLGRLDPAKLRLALADKPGIQVSASVGDSDVD